MSDTFGSLAPLPEDPILPRPRNPAMPADWAQEGVRRVFGSLGNLVMAPRRAMDQGMTTVEAIPWAGDMALNMAGAGGLGAVPGAVGAAGGRLVQPAGIRAYHGSPHDFERFDISKIGTGEGAQSYGHGLYFAEAEPVARQYRDTLSASRSKLPDDIISLPPDMRQAVMTHAGTDADAVTAAKRAQYMSSNLRAVDLPKITDMIERAREAKRGRMYEVNINAKPEQFLDWDKPLAGNHPARQAATDVLKPSGLFTLEPERTLRDSRRGNVLKPEATGADIYQTVSRGLAQGKGFKPSEATAVMREAGIPGIKYLDQGSRTKAHIESELNGFRRLATENPADQTMQWAIQDATDRLNNFKETSNYVLFDDKLIDILRKYALPGMAPVGAAARSSFGSLAPDNGGM